MFVQGPLRWGGRRGTVPTDFTQRRTGKECSHQVLGPHGGCDSALHKDVRSTVSETHWSLRGFRLKWVSGGISVGKALAYKHKELNLILSIGMNYQTWWCNPLIQTL